MIEMTTEPSDALEGRYDRGLGFRAAGFPYEHISTAIDQAGGDPAPNLWTRDDSYDRNTPIAAVRAWPWRTTV